MVKADLLQRRWIPQGHQFREEPWGHDPQGEDGWFAKRMLSLGRYMMVDPMAKCEHLMERDDR